MDVMKDYRLSFATVTMLKDNIAEVIVDEGVIVSEFMVVEFHDFLRENVQAPFGLLINKKNAYSYTFEAQKSIVNMDEIKAMAVIYKTKGGLISTQMLINLNRPNNWNIKLFQDRHHALDWISNQ